MARMLASRWARLRPRGAGLRGTRPLVPAALICGAAYLARGVALCAATSGDDGARGATRPTIQHSPGSFVQSPVDNPQTPASGDTPSTALVSAGHTVESARSASGGTLERVTTPLSLAEARRLAFLRNWDLLAAKSDVDLATAQRLVSGEFPNPTVSLSTAKIAVDEHPSSTPTGNGFWDRSYDTIAAVNQLIEIGGKRRARKDAANAGLRGAEARLAEAHRAHDDVAGHAWSPAHGPLARHRLRDPETASHCYYRRAGVFHHVDAGGAADALLAVRAREQPERR